MKSRLILLFSILSFSLFAQIPDNQRKWFANVVLLDSTTRYDNGILGAGKIIKDITGNGVLVWSDPDYVDSIWTKTDSICYSNGINTYCLHLAGGGPGGSFVDSVYQNGDSICYNIASNNYCFLNKSFGVDSIYRKSGIDSIFYTKNNVEYGIKDSVGSGSGSSSVSIGDTIGSATNGSVLFAGSSGILSQNNQRLFWDGANSNLSIGLNTGSARLTIKGNGINSSSNALAVHDSTGSSNALIVRNDNYVGIGTNAPLTKLHVIGASDERIRLSNGSNNIELGCTSADNSFIKFGSGLLLRQNGTTSQTIELVGVGTNPVTTLQIRGGTSGNVLFQMAGGGAGNVSIFSLYRGTTETIRLVDNNVNDSYFNTTRSVVFGGTARSSASALVEMISTTQGFLIQRMTTAQINAIASPATGLAVYNTTENTLCFFNGTNWQKVTSTNL